MFSCPSCSTSLRRAQLPAGLMWGCEKCGGSAWTMPVLRRVVAPDTLRDVWTAARVARRAGDRPCPSCRVPMHEVEATGDVDLVPIDVCQRCHLVWFDRGERERLPEGSAPTPVVLRSSESVPYRTAPQGNRPFGTTRPSDSGVGGIRLLPAILGMPVEIRPDELRQRPIGTWVLAAVIAATSIVVLLQPAWIDRFALIPAELWRNGGITMLTSFFLHGGVLHLVGNLYFLVVFGDNVEDYLGRKRWLLLLLGATLAGSLLHTLADVNSHVPCVGASGGISGLIAFYALRFPRARLGSYLWVALLPIWLTYPAWGGFVVWMLMQLFVLWQQLAGFGNVSALAHLGGALAGAAAWWRWRDL